MRKLLVIAALAIAAPVAGQGTQVSFTVSQDPRLVSYELRVRPDDQGSATTFKRDLGFPAPSLEECPSGNDITVLPPCVTATVGWTAEELAAMASGTYQMFVVGIMAAEGGELFLPVEASAGVILFDVGLTRPPTDLIVR